MVCGREAVEIRVGGGGGLPVLVQVNFASNEHIQQEAFMGKRMNGSSLFHLVACLHSN